MSSRLRQIKSHLPSRLSRSCVTLPAISPASPREQNDNRLCCIKIPPLMSHMGNGRRQGARTWKRKDRDASYWKRVYEYPSLNEEERLLAHLKGIDGLPWKDIVVRFNQKMGLEMRQPALQMRLTRLAGRMDTLWAEENSQNIQETNPRIIQPSYQVVDQSYVRDESIYSNELDVALPSMSGLGPWLGMNDNPNYFLTNPPTIPCHTNPLYFDYNTERNSSFCQ